MNIHQAKQFIKHFFSAKRKGHGVHSPFAYQLCEEVFYNENAFYDFETLSFVREDLLNDKTVLRIEDFGAGSKAFKSNQRKVKDIAAKAISTQKQSEIFYKLINFLKAKHCLELGTSLGLNTLYFAKAAKHGSVTSIEGSKSLFDVANALAKKQKAENINFICGKFDEVLPKILNEIPALDVLYIDGNHAYEATLNYFKMALQKKHNNSVFIFDDIYWSAGMTKAWEEIKHHASVTLSIDMFYFGLIFFREEVKEKRHLKFWV
ncbi:MAG: class I SAM-dependent methyltransferase [Bacteroidetes bacterium]|nr:class I SAM-dependent methyltransferase [Bacteroidota bacterium]